MSSSANPMLRLSWFAIGVVAWLGAPPVARAQLAPGFADKLTLDTQFVTGATSATDIAFSGDGRALVTRKTGQIVVRRADGTTATDRLSVRRHPRHQLREGPARRGGRSGRRPEPRLLLLRLERAHASTSTASTGRFSGGERHAHGRPGAGDRGVPRLRSGTGGTGQPRRRRDVHPRGPALRRRGRHGSQRHAAHQQVRELSQQGQREDPAREPRRHGSRRQPAGGPRVGDRGATP